MDRQAPQFLDPRLPERFWSKCIPEPNSGCWLWFTANKRYGYGVFHIRRDRKDTTIVAHRAAYEALVSAVPPHLELDHLCRTECCVNPAHLEPVTHRVNTLRGETITGRSARQVTCKYGHTLVAETKQRKNGSQHRRCPTCHAERERRIRREAKEGAMRASGQSPASTTGDG